MKSPRISLSRALAAAALGLMALPFLAAAQDDATPPYVRNPLPDLTIPAGTSETVIKIKKTFGLQGVTGTVVRFSTTVGNVDVELFDAQTPQTVRTFLSYVNTVPNNSAGVYTYNNTLIQRAVPNFVVQGGGFFVNSQDQINQIVDRPTIPGEPGISNTRGTLAMALSNGPDSGTGDFFNVQDNTILDGTDNGGPFTVFGRVIGTLATLDGIEALPQRNFSASIGGGFENVPLVNFDGSQNATVDNLVYLNKIAGLPLVPPSNGADALLTLKVKNNNPSLLTATLTGKKLKLFYNAGQIGTARIKVFATDSAGTRTKSKFIVTVQ